MSIDLNCDMGEGMPDDAAIMPFISSANIACGYHAGDRDTMRRTVALCLKYSVAIGAHPGFNDKPNFGRTPLQIEKAELYDLVATQLEELNEVCNEMRAALHHIKLHGALYNMAAGNNQMSETVAKAVYDFDSKLVCYGLSGSYIISEAQKIGLRTAHEVFADRTYQSDGSLTPRAHEHALIEDENISWNQVLRMVKEGKVETVEKTVIPIQAETICIHGDGKSAVKFAQTIHQRLNGQGITIRSISPIR
jgi:UPF0271 protein